MRVRDAQGTKSGKCLSFWTFFFSRRGTHTTFTFGCCFVTTWNDTITDEKEAEPPNNSY